MKKINQILFVLFFGISLNGFSQTTEKVDFFVGKWEITALTPNGKTVLLADLERVDGELEGTLKNLTDTTAEEIKIEDVLEETNKIFIGFTAKGMSINFELEQVDKDNLKGSLMSGRFEASAKRIKE